MSVIRPGDDKSRKPVIITSGTMVAHYRIIEKIGSPGDPHSSTLSLLP